jgi:hypothetical protein
MHYPFAPHLIRRPEKYYEKGLIPGDGLSKQDIKWVATMYPPLNDDDHPTLKTQAPHFADISAPLHTGQVPL